MDRLPQTNKMSPDLSDRMMTLNLKLGSAGNVSVRSCEVLGQGYRNRLSFHHDGQIEQVLASELAVSIRSCLDGLPAGAHVLALPDFIVELPGLALRGLHVMVMEAKEGIRNAIFRFNKFLGTMNGAFLSDIGFDVPMAHHSEKLAINVLEEICLPILNLCYSMDESARTLGHAVPSRLADQAREFQFQTELLKRFISSARMIPEKLAPEGIEKQLANLQLHMPR